MERVTNPNSGQHRRKGNNYIITSEEINQFHEEGYIVLNDVLTEAELQTLAP